ncbi:prolactin releasing hormone 2 [Clupea harengus]|uniref:Prolactin releasing hormone 2 n=1 Tax=Clupea harengus TaxID=7950 RepID=A0A6P8GYZ0_CLUHA|nr:prolactin releasing hormone 2 [Clupea harengus]
MLSAGPEIPTGRCSFRYRRGMVAFAVLLFLSVTVTYAHSTTVEHDLHIVHNVDNRSPEIDPFWYVGRGVRPIGRFGKRVTDSGNVLSSLELLLTALREKEDLRSTLAQEESEWLP